MGNVAIEATKAMTGKDVDAFVLDKVLMRLVLCSFASWLQRAFSWYDCLKIFAFPIPMQRASQACSAKMQERPGHLCRVDLNWLRGSDRATL